MYLKSAPKSSICLRSLITAIGALLFTAQVSAGGFSAGIAPSKFELKTKAGQLVRDTITILNASEASSDYQFKTADWRLNESKGVDFLESELAPDSCRPWVRLERKNVRIRAGGQKKFRFEVKVPEGTTPRLCTFAILIEPGKDSLAEVNQAGLRFPVVGRYAAIVYLNIGNPKADIEYLGLAKSVSGKALLPALMLENKGLTYDRVFGGATAIDANGQRHELIASTFPILPGQLEKIVLAPTSQQQSGAAKSLAYPVKLKGKFDVGGKTYKINETLTQ